jgi:uncharacterized SAM-binding protein YcdF (DUF218 family)
MAEVWIVSDGPEQSDAVVVLGGGLDTRPYAAASYYHQGLVPKVLVSSARVNLSERLDVSDSHVTLNRNLLMELGVPKTAIETFGRELSNTYEESVALRDWAERNGATKIIVPSEIFSSRRVKWIMQRTFAGTTVRIQVPALPLHKYSSEHWWRSEAGRSAFENEVVKYIYYRFRY